MKRIIKRHPHVLLFGILQIFFSAPGQTFFISLFVTTIFDDLGLSRSLFAGIYSAATLSAALLLNPAGRLIDKISVNKVLVLNSLLMATGCCLIASAKTAGTLFVGFFLVRLIGQGVFGLTASTLLSKSFVKNRGKALGIMTLGFPLSEIVYPTLGIAMLAIFGWRISYLIFAATFIVLMLPLQWFLLSKSKFKLGHFFPDEMSVQPQHLADMTEHKERIMKPNMTLSTVLKDPVFFIIISASCIPPLLMTGLLFHQDTLFASHEWPIFLAASGLAVYAILKALTSVLTGPLVDNHGPTAPFSALIAMLGLGTLLAGIGGPTWIIFVYFGLMGAALGMSSPVMSVIWPNLYGTVHLGSIKGVVSTFRNGLTAFGPLPIALALDMNISIDALLISTACVVFALALVPFGVYLLRPAINRTY
ncbi:MAG: MFS family permease [Candidatus Marinamargulisbacteria bacterium]|jgi:MFS family permease